MRKQSIDALKGVLEDSHAEVRQEAALSLGAMQAESSFKSLKRLIDNDKSEAVRGNAILAMGMLGTSRAETYLQSATFTTPKLRLAGMAAMGFLNKPSKKTLKGLTRNVQHGDVAVASVSAWALSQQGRAAGSKPFLAIIQRARSPWLVSDLLLGLGRADDRRSRQFLSQVVRGTDRLKQLPVYRLLHRATKHKKEVLERVEAKSDRKLRIMIDPETLKPNPLNPTNKSEAKERYRGSLLFELRQGFSEAQQTWLRYSPNPRHAPQDDAGPLSLSIERIYVARLRAAAAMALGRRDHPQSVNALVQLLNTRNQSLFKWSDQDERVFTVLPRNFAAISLGRLGRRQGLEPLLTILREQSERGHLKTQERLDSPTRGFAAIGLGLYARARQTDQGRRDPVGYEKAMNLLAARLMDEDEKDEVRQACAVALGLTARREALKALAPASQRLGKRDAVLAGDLMLARGMLGDQGILTPAKRLLSQPEPRDPGTDAILIRRSAVLGLGVLRKESALPIIVGAWTKSYYVNREVRLALSLFDAQSVIDTLMHHFNETDSPAERAYMAKAMGQLLAVETGTPLKQFLVRQNFTMPDARRGRYQSLTNEFLVYELLPDERQPGTDTE